MTISEALRAGSARLAAHDVAGAEWNAERLLRHVLSWERSTLLAHSDEGLSPADAARYDALIAARAQRQPLQHLLGRQAFWRHELLVTPDVLIPRPETEILVEAALERLANQPSPVVVDVGTGSGNIALALAHERPDAVLHAIDISEPALRVARANAVRLGLADRVRFHLGDLLNPVEDLGGRVDLVASNPPYVAREEAGSLEPEVALHEPSVALYAPAEPLSLYRRLATRSQGLLRPGGWLLVEVGQGMAPAVRELFLQAGMEADAAIADLAGVERVVAGRRPH